MNYGHDSTIHGTRHLHVEVDSQGKVVAVWFRCMPLPFEQVPADESRAEDMTRMMVNYSNRLLAVEVETPGIPVTVYEQKGWLLEKDMEGQPHWLGIDHSEFFWTPDSDKGLRFARREDGDALAGIVDDADKITEHEWVPPVSQPAAPVDPRRGKKFVKFSIGDRDVVQVKNGGEILFAADAEYGDLRSAVLYLVDALNNRMVETSVTGDVREFHFKCGNPDGEHGWSILVPPGMEVDFNPLCAADGCSYNGVYQGDNAAAVAKNPADLLSN